MQLYKFQSEYIANLPSRAIMAAETGTGKTIMALAHYKQYGQGSSLLIVAPASKVRTGDWQREITEYFGKDNEPYYEVISYEKLARFGPKYPNWFQFKQTKWAVIADECHRIKAPSTKASRAIWEITRPGQFFVGLSATPLPNGWIDFAGYSKIFGFTKGITEFKNRYCRIQTFKGFPEIVGYYHEEELARQWQSISKPLTKANALDLPDQVFIGVDFKRPNEYTKTLVERKTAQGKLLDTAPALIHGLRQTLTPGKLDYLSDLIDGTEENVVIFYNYISEREAILDMLKRKHKTRRVYRQDGEKHELPSKEAWPDVKRSITLAHYKSGGTGVELTYASITIYFSPTYSYADYLQSIGRTHRHGQTKKVTFYNFRTRATIEEDIYRVLKTKNNFQEKQWLLEKNIDNQQETILK